MYLGNIILQLPFGMLADKLGIRPCMLIYGIMAVIYNKNFRQFLVEFHICFMLKLYKRNNQEVL